MKTIGLIGGMSWESTLTYYQIINRTIGERLGGLHSAKCLIYSLDFQEIEECQTSGDWERSGDVLAAAALGLERAGAEFILICSNTMHKVAGRVQSEIGVPLVHIADPTISELRKRGVERVGLLGTKYTMTQDFYVDKLKQAGIEVMIPEGEDIDIVNSVIYGELCLGKISEKAKEDYLRIVGDMAARGAQGVILGCTEIGLLIGQDDTTVPLFDTTYIHANHAALASIGLAT